MEIAKRRYIVILVHLFCWVIFTFGMLFSRPGEWTIDLSREACLRQFLVLAILMFVYYLNIGLLIPKLLLRKRIFLYVAVCVFIVLFFSLLSKVSVHLLNGNEITKPFNTGHRKHGPLDTYVAGMILLVLGLGISIRVIRKWQEEVTVRQQLEKEKAKTELALLKAQINPHFFFNTLNTIYSYTISDGDIARTAINNLSKMMRYVLYDADLKQTKLSQEIAFIGEYVELMKLRVSKKTSIEISMSQESPDRQIAPMLLLPFVENAFKHGVSSVYPSNISIKMLQMDRELIFTVSNTYHRNRNVTAQKDYGIGIQNTKRRLEIIYPEAHSLKTEKRPDGQFYVELIILL